MGRRRRTLGQSADRRARAHDDIGALAFEGGDRLGDALLDRRIGEPVAPSGVEQVDPHIVHGVGARARVHSRAGRTWRRARRRCAGTRSSSSASRYARHAAQRPTTNRRMAATTSAPDVLVGGVAGTGDHETLEGSGDAAFDRVDLGQRAVLVAIALDDEHGRGDRGQVRLDVPRPELGVQPDVVPSPKRGVDIVVVATEARSQFTVVVRDASRLDRPRRRRPRRTRAAR